MKLMVSFQKRVCYVKLLQHCDIFEIKGLKQVLTSLIHFGQDRTHLGKQAKANIIKFEKKPYIKT